ncbi:unnamed protein product, partial [Medioppia subpectinata]
MKTIVLLVFVIYFTISLECIIAMAYKRFKAPERWHCMDANNRGIINNAMEIRMKTPSYMPPSSQQRRILKLFEECIKSGEGFRFKKSYSPGAQHYAYPSSSSTSGSSSAVYSSPLDPIPYRRISRPRLPDELVLNQSHLD